MIYRIPTRRGFVALVLSGLVLTGTAARSEIIEQILVKVNGEILTKTELETRQVQALRQKGQSIDLATEKGNTELRKALNEITPGLLVSSVDEMLLVQRGKELGYRTERRAVQARARQPQDAEQDRNRRAAAGRPQDRGHDDDRPEAEHGAADALFERPAGRGVRARGGHRRRSAQVLRLAHERVHDALVRHVARDSRHDSV